MRQATMRGAGGPLSSHNPVKMTKITPNARATLPEFETQVNMIFATGQEYASDSREIRYDGHESALWIDCIVQRPQAVFEIASTRTKRRCKSAFRKSANSTGPAGKGRIGARNHRSGQDAPGLPNRPLRLRWE